MGNFNLYYTITEAAKLLGTTRQGAHHIVNNAGITKHKLIPNMVTMYVRKTAIKKLVKERQQHGK